MNEELRKEVYPFVKKLDKDLTMLHRRMNGHARKNVWRAIAYGEMCLVREFDDWYSGETLPNVKKAISRLSDHIYKKREVSAGIKKVAGLLAWLYVKESIDSGYTKELCKAIGCTKRGYISKDRKRKIREFVGLHAELERIDPDLKKELKRFVTNYVKKDMDKRVDPYVDKYFRSIGNLSSRSLKYTLPDLAISLRNIGSKVSEVFGADSFSTTTYVEDLLTKRFIEEVFKPSDLQDKFKKFVEERLFQPFGEQLQKIMDEVERDGITNREELEKSLRMKLREVASTSKIASSAVVTVIEIAIGTWAAGELGRGFGMPMGIASAEAIYTAQLGFFSGIWVSIVGVPATVQFIGGLIGGVFAAFVLAPIIGAAVERIVNAFKDIPGDIHKGYPKMISSILEGESGPEPEPGLIEKTAEVSNILTEAADSFREVVRMAVKYA